MSCYSQGQKPFLSSFLTVRNGAVPSPRTAASRGPGARHSLLRFGGEGQGGSISCSRPCPCSSPCSKSTHAGAHTQNTRTLLTASRVPQLSLCNNIKHGFRMFPVTKQRRLKQMRYVMHTFNKHGEFIPNVELRKDDHIMPSLWKDREGLICDNILRISRNLFHRNT